MNKLLLTAIAVVGIYQAPQQQTDPIPPPVGHIDIPSVPLPWSLPVLPPIVIDLGVSEPVFNEVEHTEDYDENQAEMQEQVASWIDPISAIAEDASTEVDTWFGPGSILPDLSTGGDFATGIDLPGYPDISAYDAAEEMGTNIGTLFANIRALATLNLDVGGITYVIGFTILCMSWMILITMIKFGLNVVDALTNLITKGVDLAIQIIDFFFPL